MIALLTAGSVFFPGVLLLTRLCLRKSLGWNESDSAIVSTRLVSSLQSLMASSIGVIIASSCSDLINDRHFLAEAYVVFATPYFVYDVYAMFLCYCHKLQVKGQQGAGPVSSRDALNGFLRKEALMVLHHIFMVVFCFPVSVFWRQGRGDFFQGLLLLPELSTPFLCLGKTLIQFQKQHTLLHKLNGLMMMGTFFCCRVLLFPYLYYAYSRFASVPLWSVPLLAPWQCNLGAALLWPLQLYWFGLLCRAASRTLSSRGPTDRTLSSRGPTDRTLSSRGPTDRTLSSRGPTDRTLSSRSPTERLDNGKSTHTD